MSENRFNKDVKRPLLDFDIDTSIRYEEYNNKRQFSGSIWFVMILMCLYKYFKIMFFLLFVRSFILFKLLINN